MPIEIREIVIRTLVGGGGAAPSPLEGRSTESPAPALDMDALVQECVRQVMQALARERDR